MTDKISPQAQQYRHKILSLLLEKHEGSQAFHTGRPSAKRPQFPMEKCVLFSDYSDEMDFRKKEAINEAAQDLAGRGMIEIHWQRFQQNQTIKKLFLNFAAIDDAYALAGIVPRIDKLNLLKCHLAQLDKHPWEWVRRWRNETELRLNGGKSGGLDLDNPALVADLALALERLPQLTENGPVPRRMFSQQVYSNSKQFESGVEKLLLTIARRFAGWDFDTDEETLENLGLLIHPKLALFAGKIAFTGSKSWLGFDALPGVAGLSSETLAAVCVDSLSAERIISIENLTSFYQLAQQVSPDLKSMVLYSGGFPNGSTQTLYRMIAEAVAAMPLEKKPASFHWGDMDLGGIRIFQHLKEHFFPDLQPWLMDVETYRANLDKGSQFDAAYGEKLTALADKPGYQSWGTLIREMLKHGKRIEQEAVCPDIAWPG